MKTVLLMSAFLLPPLSGAQAREPAWQSALHRRHEMLVANNGPGTNAALRDQLLRMKKDDQAARGFVDGRAVDKDKFEFAANVIDVDAALTAELKQIVKFNGWPAIALVGYDASNAAMLILTHTQDHAWQLSLLPQLEELADAGKIDGSALATVIDKELVNDGKLQRYGTQFTSTDGALAMYGVEDPAGLDARRAQVGLSPMEWYRDQMAAMYHLKVSGKIVSSAK